jgi:hypothetical protein
MAQDNQPSPKIYDVYTAGGETIHIRATNFAIDEGKRQITLSNDKEAWVFFLPLVAGIHMKNKEDAVRFGALSI